MATGVGGDGYQCLGVLAGRPGRSEAEVISLAQECHADFVVIDDRSARRLAAGLGLRVIGTVGVLLGERSSRRAHSQC